MSYFFKNINDSHGHIVGDRVLRMVADIIKDTIRETDVAGRYGGEEFSIIMAGTDLNGAVTVAERVRQKVEEAKIESDGKEIQLTVSIGITALKFSAGQRLCS